MNSEDFFGTTPPRPRYKKKRNEFKNSEYVMANNARSYGNNQQTNYSKDGVPRGRPLQRNINASNPQAIKKKYTEMRANQRDLKASMNMDVFTDELDDIVAPLPQQKGNFERKQRLSSVSDVMTVQCPQYLRCLSTSQVQSPVPDVSPNKSQPAASKAKPVKKPKSAKQLKTNKSFNKRISYMRMIDKLLKGNTQKRAENVQQQQHSATELQYHSEWNELIWLELQAWLSDQTVIDTDSRLYTARTSIIPELLTFIVNFNFDPECIQKLDDMCIRFKSILTDIVDVNNGDEGTVYTAGVCDKLECDFESITNLVTEISEINWAESRDSFNCLFTENECIDYSFVPPKSYLDFQDIAIHKVGEILKELCNIENMYPSTSALSKDYPYYNSNEVQEKVELLCGWFNITIDLRIKFRHIVLKFMGSKDHAEESQSVDEIQNHHSQISDEFDSNYRQLLGLDIKDLNDDMLHAAMAHLAERLLRQNSVRKIMGFYLSKHLASMIKVRKHVMPNKINSASFQIGEDSVSSRESFSRYKGAFGDGEYKICMKRIEEVLPTFDLNTIYIQAESESDVCIISPSDKRFAVFGLPSLIPIYSFLPHGLLSLMQECINLRLKQTNPNLLNHGSSSSLLTARQFVTEYKEMLECGLLARDIFTFFIVDTKCYPEADNNIPVLTAFNSNMSLMLNVYLQYTQLWLVGLLSDLPLAPRSFKDSLEQEWNFACHISPKINFISVLACSTKFVDICSAIVESTNKFLATALEAIVAFHNAEYSDNEDQSDSGTPDIVISPSSSRQDSQTSVSSSEACERGKLKAGILWYHRQRSDSPHLSRKKQTPNNSFSETVSPLSHRQYSFTSQDSNPSIRLTPNPVETQRRYHFELCRAVKEMFNEVRERAMRILSFAKNLRKKLEPAIGFNMVDIEDIQPDVNGLGTLCAYCQLYDYLNKEGYIRLGINDLLNDLNISGTNTNILKNFEIYLPSNLDGGQRSPRTEKSLWDQVQSVVFSHLELAPNDNDNVFSYKDEYGWMIFLKKPQNSSPNTHSIRHHHNTKHADVKNRRASTENIKRKNNYQRKNNKWNSDGNLLEWSRNGPQSCDSNMCGAWLGETQNLDLLDTSAVENFKTAVQKFEFTNDFTAVMASADELGYLRKELTKSLSTAAKLAVSQMSVVKDINESLSNMRSMIVKLGNSIMEVITQAEYFLHDQIDEAKLNCCNLDYESQQQVKSEINEVIQSCFNFGFDYIKEGSRIMGGEFRMQMDKLHIEFAKKWMRYVKRYRSKGNGHMPRWAGQGLKFVVSVEWSYIKALTDEEFTEFQVLIDGFLNHVIANASTKQNNSSNLLSVSPVDKTILRSLSNASITMQNNITESQQFLSRPPSFTMEDSDEEDYEETPIERVRIAVEELEELINLKRQEDRIIGKVTDSPRALPVVNLGVRTVNFQWQRGTKVGEGSFGKVYTCVNVDTGVILAMKEIQFQANDHQKIRSILDEITNFEGIQHRNLVQNYGVELHHQEMYIFMEYCDGGTLEQICRLGLPETMIRRYTAQILSALSVLHANGIVHRDIKGSNIFLTSSGQAKLGDFGSALKLKNKHKTLPGEISTHIGTTTAYTAPEVINGAGGYGRSADIWSLGCVVVEMSSGKRPWHDLEPVQIMFKVGMESAPPIPENLSPEGKDFLNHCLIAKPTKRWSCDKLIGHSFVKVTNLD